MRFSRDRRGQSVVVGTVILFGFLILALSLYQVQIVPQENAQVEFQHFEEVRNDLVELRAGILQAGSTDRPQYQTVRLGTTYSTRVFAINPPDPAGTIRTTESYPITITNGSDTLTIPTRFVQYRPGYNELDRSATWYDASVLYLDARDDGGGIAVIEGQDLVNDAGEVKIVALQNEFRRSGTGRVTVELRPAETVTGSIPEGDLNVTVPTRMSGTEYWDGAGIPTGVYGGVTGDANGDGVHNLTLNTTATDLTVDTVGVQEAPEDPTQNGGGTGGNDGGDGGGDGGGGGETVLNYVDTYNDGDGNLESNENNSIPPNNPIGDVNDFSKMTTGDDNQYGQITEKDTGGNSYEMAIGLSVGGIPSRTSHALQIQYYMDKPEELTVNIVYENGTEIDSSTIYTLPTKKQNQEGTEEFTLSNSEINYINNNSRVYLVLNDSESKNQQTRLYADFVRIESS